MLPTKPEVQQPASWSRQVQQILEEAQWKALSFMVDAEYGDLGPIKRLHALQKMFSEIKFNYEVTREFYDRTLYFISRVKPRSLPFSSYGSEVDRAETRLKLWLDIYEGVVYDPL